MRAVLRVLDGGQKLVVHDEYLDDETGEISYANGLYFDFFHGPSPETEEAALKAFAKRSADNLGNLKSLAYTYGKADAGDKPRIYAEPQ